MEKEIQEMLDAAKADVKKAIKESEGANKERVALLEKDLEEIKGESVKSKESYDAASKEIERIASELKALKETPAVEKPTTLKMQLEGQAEALKTLKEKKGSDINIVVKAAGTMTTGNVTPVGSGISMLLNDPESGVTPLPRSAPFFMSLFPAVQTTGNTISYAEMVNPDGGAGMTGEGAAKTQADFDIVESKVNVRKITSYIKTSKEALDDISALSGEINTELMTLIKLKADNQLLTGDNTGNNLNGILNIAQTFTGGDLAGTIVDPNNFDVLVAAMTEIETAEVIVGEPAGFMANVIVMHPVDVAAMRLTKDSQGQYVFPITLPGTTNVLQVPVVSNARMTAGDFLVMDSTKANLRVREGINLNIGYENDDFTKNLVTILAEMRLCIYVKSQHTKAFVKGTFSTGITALKVI